MNINWRDILGEISGYKPLYQDTLTELHTARARIGQPAHHLLTAANDTIRRLGPATCTTPAPAVPDNTPEKDTAPVQPQEGTVLRRIRSQQVIDCPRENRDVPLYATEAGANHDQLTCRSCPQYKSET